MVGNHYYCLKNKFDPDNIMLVCNLFLVKKNAGVSQNSFGCKLKSLMDPDPYDQLPDSDHFKMVPVASA